MQTYKYRTGLRVSQSGTIVEGGIFVCQSRLDHLETLRFERAADLHRKLQNNFAFAYAAGSARAGVRTTVCGIENHNT